MTTLPRRHRAAAFTLLEVMAAVLIIGFAVVALLQIQGSIMNRTMSVRDRARALIAAETVLDSFLAQPEFGDLSSATLIDEQAEVTLEGYDDFIIIRRLQERTPLLGQETVELYPELAQTILDKRLDAASGALDASAGGSGQRTGSSGASGATRGQAAASANSGENPFDPGAFVAVRVEVRQRSSDRLLSMLEMWLPMPPRPEEESR